MRRENSVYKHGRHFMSMKYFKVVPAGKDKILQKYTGEEASVVIPDNITIIAPFAFENCSSLRTIEFPPTIKSIEKYAFFNCPNYTPGRLPGVQLSDESFYNCGQEQLCTVTLADIQREKMAFYVRDYQRGYRWTKPQLTSFVDDLISSGATGTRCFMQPIVVKKVPLGDYNAVLTEDGLSNYSVNVTNTEKEQNSLPESVYEIVDGQQRLTTLWLLLTVLKEKPTFSIFYENKRGVDQAFHENAKKELNDLRFGGPGGVGRQRPRGAGLQINHTTPIQEALHNKLTFVWYQFDEENAETKFRTLNDGQIALTSAELTKAALLNALSESPRQEMIAAEWDQVEHQLQDDEFWYFLSRTDFPEKSRMDFLLELYVRSMGQKELTTRPRDIDLNQENFPYYVLSSKDDDRLRNPDEFWRNIKKTFDSLRSWYEDDELYWRIGYLVACDEKPKGFAMVSQSLVNIGTDYIYNNMKKGFRRSLDEMIGKRIEKGITLISEPDFYVQMGAKGTRDILLYFNVTESRKAGTRFPFHRFNHTVDENKKVINWDVEHISAITMKDKLSDMEKDELKDWALKEWESMGQDPDQFSWEAFTIEVNSNPDHSISNLVLLDAGTNRGYKNEFFFNKRKTIIERDKRGKYIPLGTRNVFLKYYTEKPDTQAAWTEADKTAYRKVIESCFNQG